MEKPRTFVCILHYLQAMCVCKDRLYFGRGHIKLKLVSRYWLKVLGSLDATITTVKSKLPFLSPCFALCNSRTFGVCVRYLGLPTCVRTLHSTLPPVYFFCSFACLLGNYGHEWQNHVLPYALRISLFHDNGAKFLACWKLLLLILHCASK